MNKREVDIVVLENGYLEAQALRATLEAFNVKVNTFWIGQPKDMLDIFSDKRSRSEYVVICGHGDEQGFIFWELGEEYKKDQPWGERMGAEDIKNHLNFSSHVLASGCNVGTKEITESFIQKGAKSYIAPQDYIEGNSALFFLISFFYAVFEQKKDVKDAVEFAKTHDKETNRTLNCYTEKC